MTTSTNPGKRLTRSQSVAFRGTEKANTMSVAKRTIHAKSIKSAHAKLIDADINAMEIVALEDRLQMLEQEWADFRSEHGKVVEQALDPDDDKHEKAYEEIPDIYLATRTKIRTGITKLKPSILTSSEAAPVSKLQVEVSQKDALADIPNTWGTFNGDYLKWPSFRDRFMPVHKKEGVLAIHKFQYLKAAVTGPAAQAMGNLEITEDNYKLAWERLCSVYEDNYLIVGELHRKLFSIQKLKRASNNGLRLILDTIHDCLGQFESHFDTK